MTTMTILKCEDTVSGGGRYPRPCGRPAKLAVNKWNLLIAVCKTHANSTARWGGKVFDLTDENIATIATRRADEKAREDEQRAARRADAEKRQAERVKRLWTEYDLPWTSTLVLDMGWREDEVRKLDIICHPAGEEAERSWDGFHVEVEMDDDGEPAVVRVRNANRVTPAAANELTQAIAQAALWVLELNGR